MANWTNKPQPFGANRAPLLTGLSAIDGVTPVPVAVDPATGNLQTGASFSASSLALNDGVTTTRKATVANLTNANPLAVEIVDGSGTQITSFGGGTQYANGAVQATPTGTVALGWDTANVRALSTDSSGKLNISTIAGTVTVSGTVTANAGTNLNTSALALDATLTGGNQQVQGNVAGGSADSGNPVKIGGINKTTPLTLTDGQRGDMQLDTRENVKVSLWAPNSNTAYTFGNGVSGTGVQRVTLASDSTGQVTLAAGSNVIGALGVATSGGLTPYTGSVTNTATQVKSGAGQVYGWYIYNNNSTQSYIQFYNVANASITVGTTTPTFSIGIPANSGANVFTDIGIAFGTAINIAATTTRAGSTAPSNNLDVNVFYD